MVGANDSFSKIRSLLDEIKDSLSPQMRKAFAAVDAQSRQTLDRGEASSQPSPDARAGEALSLKRLEIIVAEVRRELEKSEFRLAESEKRSHDLALSQADALVNSAEIIEELEETKNALRAAHQIEEKARRAAERAGSLGRILDHSGSEIYVFDNRSLKFVYANQGAKSNIGYSMRELRELTPYDIKPGVSAEQFEEMLAPLRAGASSTIRITTKHARKDGSLYPVEGTVHESTFEGRPAFVAVMLNVTERHRIEEELRESKNKAVAADIAKSQFLANMSHEIRTPLNGVIGFTDLLIKEGAKLTDSERLEHLASVRSSGKHLLSLINNILDLSKIESGKLELECIEYSPQAIMAETISLLRVTAAEKGLWLKNEWVGLLPKTIRTDPTRLRQLLVNLIGNAIKFTDKGGVRLVSRMEKQGEQNLLRIDVIDTGVGIAADKLDAIFDPFSQADNSITRQFGGTGLGLTISRRLAKALGGGLTIESELGVGSTFTIRIDVGPLDGIALLKLSNADGIANSETTKKSETAAVVLPPARILIVEDGEINQRLFVALLQCAGVEQVDIAENGEIGVQRANENTYDLILMDMQMPVMDGYTAASELRRQGHCMPIVALTAHAMKGDRKKCTDAGCTDYLPKPIVTEDFLHKIAELLADAATPSPNIETKDTASRPQRNDKKLVSTLPTQIAVFQEIVQEFGVMLEELMRDLHSAARATDRGQIAQLAHNLAGTAGGAGFNDFTEPARRLESIAPNGQFSAILATIDELDELAHCVAIPECADATI